MWIEESIRKGKRMKDHYNVNGVDIFIKDPLPDHIDTAFVFEYISTRIPFYFLSMLKSFM